ncbi:hypothetical protein RAH42_09460 [Pyramidobacter sp. YE332]|uniref:hypothetical protein n=1 Tax=Pyramidobacter sp. YE332 TaxID=3068894 RepID=UPI00294B04FB|nr:hypothetical protein [Pyramidobacter sp. YE332]WOL39368.1 hypothetical protein RAH42_09460 [Pyramidobacter sp. YE332]
MLFLDFFQISDLTMVDQQVRSVTYASFETFIFVAVIYLVLTSVTSGALRLNVIDTLILPAPLAVKTLELVG